MYNEKMQEKNYDKSTKIHQPELAVIVDRLQNVINRYDDIVCETKNKLQMIKKYEEPATLKEVTKEKQPESVTEEIHRLICLLDELNERALSNLRHLREIV
jgi:hypothetical protein